MARRDQRDVLTDHLGDHVDDELIRLLGIEKSGNKLSTADQPDVLAFFRTQPFGEVGHAFVNNAGFAIRVPLAGVCASGESVQWR